MRIAILADIHANREAFETVLADLEGRDIDRLALLGDIVGYGPDPEWCTDKARALVADGAIAVRGNHDHAIRNGDADFNITARRVIRWTRERLDPAQSAFLSELPFTHREGGVLFVHASANSPEDWNYVSGPDRARASFATTDARCIIVGHRHVPDLISCDLTGRTARHRPTVGLAMPLIGSRRWLAVVGSVGQPRDGIAKAAYAVLDTARQELTFLRVPYNILRTVEKLRQLGLPESLALRLNWGA